MGNEQNLLNNPLSKFSSSNFLKTFSKNYSFLKESRDPCIGHYQLFKHNDNISDFLIMKSLPMKMPLHLLNNISTDNPNFLKILHISTSNEELICGDSHKMTVFSEYFNYTLASELERRSRAQEFFPENEIWYLLNSLIFCGEHLQRNQEVHGSLTPETIYLTPEGHVKLINMIYMHNELDSYHNILGDSNEKGFLSPSLMEELKRKALNPRHNRVKSDVWAVGMIALYAGSLFNTRNLYNYQEKTMDFDKLVELIEGLRSLKYSAILRNIMVEMLQINETDRPDFQELREFLSKPVDELEKASKFNLYQSPDLYKSRKFAQSQSGEKLKKNQKINWESQNQSFQSQKQLYQSQKQLYQSQNCNYQSQTINNSQNMINHTTQSPNVNNPRQNPLYLSQNSPIYKNNNGVLQNSKNQPFHSQNSNTSDITRFKPMFVTPRKIIYLENSPTVRILNETPKENYNDNLEKFKQNYGEIEQGLDDLHSKIEKALDRSAVNVDKYREIIH